LAELSDRRALALLLALTVAHVALALHFPLASDETYYWDWSRALDWGYYDQAPFIAWLIRASTAIFGSTEFGVRACIVGCASMTLWLVYLTGRCMFGERAGLAAMLLAGVTPMGLAGGFIATYDVPLALFWAAALYCMACATRTSNRPWPVWMALGVVAGLGLLSKYTMVLFLACALLCFAARSDLRIWLRRPQPYVAMLIALAILAPNLVWQTKNDWVSFGHMAGLTVSGAGPEPMKRVGDFVGSQIGLMTPLLFLGMLAAMVEGLRRRDDPKGSGAWMAFCFGAPVLVFFVLLSLKAKVQANWAICGWIGASLGYAGWVWGDGGGRRRTAYAWTAIAMAAFISLMAGWPELRSAIGPRVPAKLDQSRKMYGGRELGAAIEREVAAMSQKAEPPVIGAVTYDVAGRMAFYAPGQPRAACLFLGTRDNQYRFLNAHSGLRAGRNMLIADHRPPNDPLLAPFGAVFERVEPVPAPLVVRVPAIYDEPVVTYYLYRCYGYTGRSERGAGPISYPSANSRSKSGPGSR